MKRVITLCLAMAMAVGAASAAKPFKVINFESGEAKGLTVAKTTSSAKVIDVNRGEKNKKAFEANGTVTANFVAQEAGKNYKFSVDSKLVAGAKPMNIIVKTVNPADKKAEVLVKQVLPKDKEFKTTSVEFTSKYPKGKITVAIATVANAKDNVIVIDNLKFVDMDAN